MEATAGPAHPLRAGNDVANAIGPFNVLLEFAVDDTATGTKGMPFYVAMVGGLAIVVGLLTWGYKVMRTVGEKITRLTFTKGFAAQFGASISVLVATILGIPISTTAVLVGSVTGVGLVDGNRGVDLKLIGRIVVGWVVTLPAAGIVTALVFFLVNAIVA